MATAAIEALCRVSLSTWARIFARLLSWRCRVVVVVVCPVESLSSPDSDSASELGRGDGIGLKCGAHSKLAACESNSCGRKINRLMGVGQPGRFGGSLGSQ